MRRRHTSGSQLETIAVEGFRYQTPVHERLSRLDPGFLSFSLDKFRKIDQYWPVVDRKQFFLKEMASVKTVSIYILIPELYLISPSI